MQLNTAGNQSGRYGRVSFSERLRVAGGRGSDLDVGVALRYRHEGAFDGSRGTCVRGLARESAAVGVQQVWFLVCPGEVLDHAASTGLPQGTPEIGVAHQSQDLSCEI